MRSLAIIPARSGSKGLRDKNIRLLDGKPLMAYTIEAAIKSEMFDTVHLSTDSARYAEIGRLAGADCDFLRSDDNASDAARTSDVVAEVMAEYASRGITFDHVSVLQPTSPLRNHENIRSAFGLFESENALAVVSVCEADHPIGWFHRLSSNGSMEDFIQLNSPARRQDEQIRYRVNGAIYIMRSEIALNMDKLYGDRTFGYIMPRMQSIDIDEEIDFVLAECLIRNYHG